MTVTIAMGWHLPVGDLVEMAVRTALAQTYRDSHVVVIGDGAEPPLAGIRSSRLEVYTIPHNRGAYFALQLVLMASGHRWMAPYGADDWTEPEHLQRLAELVTWRPGLRDGVDIVKTGRIRLHLGEQDTAGKLYPPPNARPSPFEVGLFRRVRLLQIGGWNPCERIGQDTLTMRLLGITGPVALQSRYATYHRLKRAGSLTTDPETGHGSRQRREVRVRNRQVFDDCTRLREPGLMRQYREALVSAQIRDELAEHSARLGALLGAEAAA